MLRKWQSECVNAAIEKYQSGRSHFFCQATPGAGKTIMAAEIAALLLEKNLVDIIICFSPSTAVASGIKHTFSKRLGCSFNGELGSIGLSLTYQSLRHLKTSFINTLKKYRVFIVFDEIHHCAGGEQEQSNAWGEDILFSIQKVATYTLALSGTPWRTDALPIVFAEYSDPEGKFICDYQYTLAQAIQDNVCRRPKIVLIDNENLRLTDGEGPKLFSSIKDILGNSDVTYKSIINNNEAIEHLLSLSSKKLELIRKTTPNAGGLIVTGSVNHAKLIASILVKKFGKSTSIVTYHHPEPLAKINAFRDSSSEWIVSVGMISEGTDIPRLQVCCHISSVRTELYFRQVLGRVLRVNGSLNNKAYMYTLAEPSIVKFAERIEEDIPDTLSYLKSDHKGNFSETSINNTGKTYNKMDSNLVSQDLDWSHNQLAPIKLSQNNESNFDELTLGQFRERIISAFCS